MNLSLDQLGSNKSFPVVCCGYAAYQTFHNQLMLVQPHSSWTWSGVYGCAERDLKMGKFPLVTHGIDHFHDLLMELN